ncbi:unnamed protein product [Rotaria magnacalcarata]|uniref:Protein kinase domain-containing protein n=1 Tax=Rotaria magnacalcarata TaxID=392030 RepID=A0A819J3X0_9BILA|nr:unnamed protein product [Rotaria magnacalcarata]CAF1366779.1 unnamed protein product [Rotaria magnacalcarata]CAF2032942.1 unnamed protein product [Rotaria magnacalcarata]CAF2036452.1 unnamed protein product [Rotaria magnacalcarata]CAF2256852.1 unnamed protein product [Rotaria magnacalcarata]
MIKTCITSVVKVLFLLQNIVEHYRIKVDRLSYLLTYPCQKVKLTVPVDKPGLLEFDRSQLFRRELFDKGNYGEVFKGKYDQRDVISKCMALDNEHHLGNVNKFFDKAKIKKDLLHKNTIHLYGVCIKEEPISMATEYMAHGYLLNYLRDGSGRNLTLKLMCNFAAQVKENLKILENSLNINH